MEKEKKDKSRGWTTINYKKGKRVKEEDKDEEGVTMEKKKV